MTGHDKLGLPLSFGIDGTSPIPAKKPRVIEVPPVRKVPHCAIRAKERYGIDLTWDDVRELTKRCRKGEGHTGTTRDGKQFHMIIFGARVLHVVYKPEKSDDGIVLTIMPPEIARVTAANSGRQAARRKGEFGRPKKAWR